MVEKRVSDVSLILSLDLLSVVYSVRVSKFAAIKVLLEFRKVANIPRKMLFVYVLPLTFAFVYLQIRTFVLRSQANSMGLKDMTSVKSQNDKTLTCTAV